MKIHDLIKHGPGHYECLACLQTWKMIPRSNCPGIKLYPKNDYAPLMTKQQLGYMGYQTTKNALPAPVGCFFSRGANDYVSLYNPTEAIKKKTPPQRRVTTLVTEIHWPKRAVPLIRDLSDYLQDRDLHKDRTYEGLINEVANTAAHFAAFTPSEIKHFADEVVSISISPSLLHRSYPSFEINSSEQIALASRIAIGYKKL